MSKKPAYFPMSDTEDNEISASEPYSSEYHKKMANRSKQPTLDAVHDDAAIDSFDAPSSSRSADSKSQQPMMLISSVRSLHTLSNGLPPAENSSSVSSQDSVLRQHRQMFGIAKINPEPQNRPNRKASKLSSLLKEVEPPQHVARRNKTKPHQAVSKIGKLRKALDDAYKGRIHTQGPKMEGRRRRMASSKVSEIVAAAAKSSEDESDEEENDDKDDDNQSDENTSPYDDSSRSSMAKTKVTPASQPAAKTPSFAVPHVTGSSRRKTAHKPITNDDDIMFVEVDGTVVTVAPRSSVPSNPPPSPTQIRPRPSSTPPLSPRSLELQGVRAIENPNADLIKKVAFLRCCVNYMMSELDRKPYSFHRYSNLNYLTSRYKQNKIVNQTKK